jgi:hypothetical protein
MRVNSSDIALKTAIYVVRGNLTSAIASHKASHSFASRSTKVARQQIDMPPAGLLP